MSIEIALKLRPFSHCPGIKMLIPYTTWEVEIFPAMLKFFNLEKGEKRDLPIDIEGPVLGFTALQDLEKGRIEVFGRGKRGYFRYLLSVEGIEWSQEDISLLPFLDPHYLPPSSTRLSLGVHKKQDWDLICRRADLAEIFPFWLRLAQLIPYSCFPRQSIGTWQLLQEGRLQEMFAAGFQGILSPRLQDERHLGLVAEVELEEHLSAVDLLHEGARQILALFFVEEEAKWHILPALPKAFHAGRLVDIKTASGDFVSLEWSKKEIKKIMIRAGRTGKISLCLKKGIHSFRLKRGGRLDRGKRVANREAVELHQGEKLLLDQFMH